MQIDLSKIEIIKEFPKRLKIAGYTSIKGITLSHPSPTTLQTINQFAFMGTILFCGNTWLIRQRAYDFRILDTDIVIPMLPLDLGIILEDKRNTCRINRNFTRLAITGSFEVYAHCKHVAIKEYYGHII